MKYVGPILSSLVVTAVGVAFIFRVDMVRSLVTGIQTAPKGGATPAAGSVLYI
jgi:hypothetical protein